MNLNECNLGVLVQAIHTNKIGHIVGIKNGSYSGDFDILVKWANGDEYYMHYDNLETLKESSDRELFICNNSQHECECFHAAPHFPDENESDDPCEEKPCWDGDEYIKVKCVPLKITKKEIIKTILETKKMVKYLYNKSENVK